MESNNNSNNSISENSQLVIRNEEDNVSNLSYSSKDDDDQILTATITFDVTVDPNGQVISATEGQIVAETTVDGRKMSLSDHQRLPSVMKGEAINEEDLPQENDVSLNNIQPTQSIKLQDSLEESDTDESTSTSTESLIERSKKYMNQEAGIIILKRDNTTTKNFNINLDFDLKNENNPEKLDLNPESKNFNINLDIDVPRNNNESSPSNIKEDSADNEKNFNINLDFDLKNNRPVSQESSRKRGVDIDLMITNSTTTSNIEKLEDNINEESLDDYLHTIQERASADLDPLKTRLPRYVSSNKDYYDTNDSYKQDKNQQIGTKEFENDNGRFNFIERLVQNASMKDTAVDKENYYRKQLPNAESFNIEKCIDGILNSDNNLNSLNSHNHTVLRPFETVDFEALTKCFEPEEVKEGKLVLYITEPQLLQLLKQRAIIVPDKNKLLQSHDFGKQTLSLVDENIGNKLGRNSPIKEVELIVDHDNNSDKYRPIQSVSNIRENNPGTRSGHNQPEDNALKAVDDLVDRLLSKNQINNMSGRSSRAYGAPLRETPSIHEPHEPHVQSAQFSSENTYNSPSEHDYTQSGQFSSTTRTGRTDPNEHIEIDESDNALKAVDELVDRILNNKPKNTYSIGSERSVSADGKHGKSRRDSIEGRSGKNGRDGNDGRDGDDFYVKKGVTNGKNGRNGKPGKDGKVNYVSEINLGNDNIGDNSSVRDSRIRGSKFPGTTDGRDSVFSELNSDKFKSSQKGLDGGLDTIDGLEGLDGLDGIDGPNGRNAIDIYKEQFQHGRPQSASNFSGVKHIKPENQSSLTKNGRTSTCMSDTEVEGNQLPSKRIGTSYSGLTEASPNIGQIVDPKLLTYKDFDLLLPSDRIKNSTISTPFEYIKIGSENDSLTTSLAKIPKSYDFLNKGLEFTKFNDEEVPKELERLISRVSSSLDDKTGSVNLKTLSETYRNPEDKDKLDLLKKFRNGLKPNRDDEDKLKLLDKLIEKLLKPDSSNIPVKETLSQLEDLKKRVGDIPKRNTKDLESIKKSLIDVNSNKIIIKTTRKLPSKVYTTCNDRESKQFVKKKVVYSYLDDYRPNTRVYEVSNNNISSSNKLNAASQQNFKSFNASNSFNYSLKPFDPINPSQNIIKPSVEQINKYLSVVNTGVKNNDLIQIHPLLNSQTHIKNKLSATSSTTLAKYSEPMILDSSMYPSYGEDISKQFSGLQITDFPLYVQGLESDESHLIKHNLNDTTQADIEQSVSQQVVNSLNEYVKANSINSRSIVLAQ